MVTLYQATNPQAVYSLPSPADPDYGRFVEDGQMSRGLRSALIGASADSTASDYWQARAAGDLPRADANRRRGLQLAAEAQRAAPRVQSIGNIHSAGDFADWGAGVMGSLPVSSVPAMGGGLAGSVLGGIAGGPVGAAIGSQLGASGGTYPQLRDAARLQQMQAEQQQGATQLAPQQVLDDTSRQGGWQALIEGVVPGLASRSLVRGTAANVLRQPVASAVKRVGRDVLLDTGAAGISENVAMGYETGRNPNRDTSGDDMRLLDAMAGEAVGGVGYGAIGHAGDVAHGMLGTGLNAAGDAASYAARAGQKGAQAAWDARPQSWDEAALMVGEGAASLHNQAEDVVTRWTQKGRDADVDALLTPQKGMDEAGLRADDANKHTATANLMAKLAAEPDSFPDYVHAAAAQYAQGSKTMDSWRPVADAINDMHRSESILSGANDMLAERLAPVAETLGKTAADARNAMDDVATAYNGKRAADGRQNAMTPAMGRTIANERDDFSPILEEYLAPFTGLKTEDALANALPTLGHAMRNWVTNGFSMKQGGETVVPKALLGMFDDPAEAIKVTTDLMHKEGLVSDDVLSARERVLQQLEIMQTAKKQAWDIVDSNLTPTAARGKSSVDHDLIAEHYQDKLQAGASLESLMPAAQRHFGPRAIPVLEALKAQDEAMRNAISGRDRRSGGEQRASGIETEMDDDNAGQNIIPGMDAEGMAQITSSSLDDEAGKPTVKYHHYSESRTDKATGGMKPPVPFQVGGVVKNRPDKLGNAVPDTLHDTAAEKRIAELHGSGSVEAKRQGYMDYLREKNADDRRRNAGDAKGYAEYLRENPDGNAKSYMEHLDAKESEGLMNDVQNALRDKIDVLAKLQAKTKRTVRMEDGSKAVIHDPAEKVLNDNFYVLREEAQRVKAESTNILADELGREGSQGQIIGNKWEEKVGKDGEYGTTAHGRIWLERMGSDGKPRAFATSASRIIDRMFKGQKADGSTEDKGGLAGQHAALHQGVASLMAAAHPVAEGAETDKSGLGKPVLTGRVGYKEAPDGPIRWMHPGADFPDSLRMYTKDGKTYGDAKAAVKGDADQKILTDGKSLLKSLSTRLANMAPAAKGRGYVIEDIEELDAALKAGNVRVVDASLRKSEKYELGREDDGVADIGADTYETKPVGTTTVITRDARKNLFGSKKAALEHAKALAEPGVDLRVVKRSESILNASGEASTRVGRVGSRAKHQWVIERTQRGQVRNSAETKSGKPTTRSVQVWREISSHSSQAEAQAAYDAHVRQLVDEQGDDGSGWPDLRVSKMEGSAESETGKATPERWAFQEAHYLRSGSIPFGSEIGEMGKATEIRSRHEDGEANGERTVDETTGATLLTDAQSSNDGQLYKMSDKEAISAMFAKAVADKDARVKRTEFVRGALAKGAPSFVDTARKLSPERREGLTGHLQGMLDGKFPEGGLDESESARARVVLIALGKMTGSASTLTRAKARSNAEANAAAKPAVGKLEGYTNHSGAARGADTLWDVIGRKFGVTAHNHYRAEGNVNIPPALKSAGVEAVVATKEQLDEGYKVLEGVLGKKLERSLANDLKARNYLQVKNADAVFAIAELRTGKGDVKGGTNAAVQMAIHLNKPVHVWDTGSMTWHKWDGSTFVPTTTPTLTKNFAGIGTRDVENYNVPDPLDSNKWVPRAAYKGYTVEKAARQAIADVYRKTAGQSDASKPASAAETSQPAATKPVTTLAMNYKDGSNGLSMRPEFKGKDTMDLILSGDRTATTRTSLAGFNGIKKGDVFKVEGNGKSALVRATTDPYKASTKTAEEWSKLEGWAPKEHSKYARGSVDGYQIQYELVENLRNNAQRVESRIGRVADDKLFGAVLSDKAAKEISSTRRKLREGAEKAWVAGKTKQQYLESASVSEHIAHLVAIKAANGDSVQNAIDTSMNQIDQVFAAPLDMDLELKLSTRLQDTTAKVPFKLADGMNDIIASTLPPSFKVIAKAVKQISGHVAITSADRATIGADLDGTYSAETDTVVLYEDVVGIPHTLLHEGVHAATMGAVVRDKELHRALYALMAHVSDANSKLTTAYGLTDALEFLAEGLSNENLQRELFKIPASKAVEKYLGKTLANAWEAFVGLVRKALNLPAGHESALTQLLDLSGRAMIDVRNNGPMASEAEAQQMLTRGLVPLAKVEANMRKLENSPLLSAPDRAYVKSEFTDDVSNFVDKDGRVPHAVAVSLEVATQLLKVMAARGVHLSGDQLVKSVQAIMSRAGASAMVGSRIATESRNNKQAPGAAFGTATSEPASKAEQERFHADILRRLGPQMKSGLVEVLMGKNAKGKDIQLSGKWEKGAIYASVYARNIGQIGAHEAFHEFFDRMKGEPAAAEVMKILDRAANAPYVVRQLERLLDGETEALKQIKKGAPNAVEERMAYMFQFWEAGLLNIGPETQNVLAKIAKFFRWVAGLLNDDDRADMLLRNFDEGKMQTADAAARVLANSVTARQKLYEGVNGALQPMMGRVSRLVNTAETNLERTGNPAYKQIRRMFKRSVGEDGGQGFLDAKDHQMKMWSNKLAAVFEGLHPKDLALAAPYLHTGQTPKDPAVKQLVARLKGPNGLLPQMHDYLKRAGVERFQPNPDGRGGEWVPMGKIDHGYFPRAYDLTLIMNDTDAFVADFAKYNAAELNAIAAKENELMAIGTKPFTPMTAEDVAKAITSRLLNAFGSEVEENGSAVEAVGPGQQGSKVALKENQGGVGFSPFMQAINQRQLHWIHPEMLKKYGEKDVAKVLTGYVAQAVKRAEYVRRFGNGGSKLKAKLREAYTLQLDVLAEKEFGPNAKDIFSTTQNEDMADQRRIVEAALATAGQKDVAARLDALEKKALKIAGEAATDVMAMEGTLGYNIGPKMRKFQNSVVVYQNVRTLSTSLFSQFIDPLGQIVRGATMSDAWNAYKRGMREIVASIKDDPIKDLDSQIAEQVGTVDSQNFLAMFGQMYSSQYLGTNFRKANDVLFKYNGMEGFNRGMQVSATRSAINFIKRHVEKPNERSKDYLLELNLKAGDVKIDPKTGELDYANPRIQRAIHQWVNGSVLRPNAAQRPAWASDPHYMVFWHMKQFAYTFHDTIMKRALHDYKKYGDMGPAGVLVAAYTPVMIASDAIKSLLLTGDEPTWMKAGLDSELQHGAMRAGLAGKFQPFVDVMAPHHTPLGLGGPAIEQITEMFTDTPRDSVINALPGANVWNTMKGNEVADGHADS